MPKLWQVGLGIQVHESLMSVPLQPLLCPVELLPLAVLPGPVDERFPGRRSLDFDRRVEADPLPGAGDLGPGSSILFLRSLLSVFPIFPYSGYLTAFSLFSFSGPSPPFIFLATTFW